MATYEAVLPDIACDGCMLTLRMVARIEKDIQSVDGQTATKTVSIKYDESKIDQSGVESWLIRSGYPPFKQY